jgi:hypothetical protein
MFPSFRKTGMENVRIEQLHTSSLIYRERIAVLLDQMQEIGYADASVCIYWSNKFGYLGSNQIEFV